ncbi:MAG: fasciclin domain-containing protein [Legionella sp.]|nr:fasciclin domain-containing protein [Legionella sp.]
MKGFKKLAAVLAASLVWVSSYAADMTIVDVASGNPEFSTLVSLLKKADLVSTLQGSGPFTVFAPTNAAFEAIPKDKLDALAADPEKLKAVLLYHVVSGNVPSSKIQPGSVNTVEGQAINVTTRDGKVYVNDIEVVKADVDASNGVIHVINGVLLPPQK